MKKKIPACRFRGQKGQTLLEALVAIALIVFVIVALVGLGTTAISRTKFAENQAKAKAYTQEAAEWVRSERDSSWATFAGKSAGGAGRTYCFNGSPISSWPAVGPCGGFTLDSLFKREAVLTNYVPIPPPPNPCSGSLKCVEVKITVSWQEGGQTHSSVETTRLTNWSR